MLNRIRAASSRVDGDTITLGGVTYRHGRQRCSTGSTSPLLARLIERRDSRYVSDSPTWSDRALFRSLNMATHAARMPFNTAGTFYDTGRLVVLWIGAFEILVHPETSESNRGMVLRMLESIPTSQPLPPPKSTFRCLTLKEWALNHMYDARNDYCTAIR